MPLTSIGKARLASVLLAAGLVGCLPLSGRPAAVPTAVMLPGSAAGAPRQSPSSAATSTPLPTPEPTRALKARLSWLDEFGGRTLVFDTEAGEIKIRRVGGDSLMLKFGDSIVHVNPLAQAQEYAALPKADQIWITDPAPEHLDLRTIRQVSTENTRLILDPESAGVLKGLAEYFTLQEGMPIQANGIQLEAVPAYVAQLLPAGAELNLSNSYLATFGSFRLLIASRAHLLPLLHPKGPVDVALLVLDEASALTPEQGAWAAETMDLQAVLPYQYQPEAPAELADLLSGSGIAVWPLDSPSAAASPRQDDFPARDPALADAIALGVEPELTLVDSLRPTMAGGPALLLPDLQTFPPTDLRLVRNSYTQTTVLRLTNSVVNAGEGPLEMWGTQLPGLGTHQVVQRMYDTAGGYAEQSVGQFVFHPQHSHWHLDGFSLYELWSVHPDGTLDQVLATSGKVSFCLRDIRRSRAAPVISGAAFSSCGTRKQGISAGWIDSYQYYLPGQSIDVTGLPDGRYALMSTADPYNLIREAEEGNNFALIYLSLEGGRVQVLADPSPFGYSGG
jgi:L-ascorbate metabolism protein UlaG (beta-lactamase superfamily)